MTLFPAELRARLAPAGQDVPHPGRFPTAPLPDTVDAAIAQFTEACVAVGGRVSSVTGTADAAAIVRGYLDAPDWRPAPDAPPRFVSWDEAQLPLPGLLGVLGAHAEHLDAQVRRDAEGRADDYQRLDGAIVGITGADAALADTGSVALIHGGGRPRLVSVLPPVHVALVPVGVLRSTLGDWFAERPDVLHAAANVVIVTGPSRTADIEMTLTRGVHGPRLVHVVFVG